MSPRQNALGQPIGFAVPNWTPCARPPHETMNGRLVRLEMFDLERHGPGLFRAYSADTENRNWTYLPSGPFETEADYLEWAGQACCGDDPLFHVVIEQQSGKPLGVAALMRMVPEMGVIEVGHVNFSPGLQRSAMATEAMFLMMRRVFSELKYRRYEWKCDALNGPSRRAAERLGFRLEGVFRQFVVYKGRNRDTAWFSILDHEWPAIEAAFLAWLAPENFDETGAQISKLECPQS